MYPRRGSARHSDCCSPYRPPPRPRRRCRSRSRRCRPCRRCRRSRCRSPCRPSQPCPGARRRSGARARRVAVGCLVNKARTRAGLRGFAWNRALARAATRHARDMARRGYFAHQRSGGPSLAAAGPRGRLPRAPRRRGDRLRLRLRRAPRSRSCACGWRARPTARSCSRGRSRVGIGIAGRPPVRCGGRGATYVLDAGPSRSSPRASQEKPRTASTRPAAVQSASTSSAGGVVGHALAVHHRAGEPVDEVLERQHLGDVAQHRRRVLLVVEDAGDHHHREEDGVHVRGRGLRVGDRVRERDAQRGEADDAHRA